MSRILAAVKALAPYLVIVTAVAGGAGAAVHEHRAENAPKPPPIVVVGWDQNGDPYVKDVWGE